VKSPFPTWGELSKIFAHRGNEHLFEALTKRLLTEEQPMAGEVGRCGAVSPGRIRMFVAGGSNGVASGKHTKNEGKSPFSMGKSM